MPNPFLFVLKLQLDVLHQWLSLARGMIDFGLGTQPALSSSSSRSLVPVAQPARRRRR